MDKRKYFTLFIPTVIILIALFFMLPEDNVLYAFIVVVLFWITYYTWVWIDKKKDK
ncbi:hypothetical protein [Oceanobacillus kimchii]|uniref:hypothetical protein n=1 Tax=Oceanobacillus kimchii TaxID=746691 RepID=UPI000345A630|nr:hypothetical protein [Oceanobacillus kimchii]